MLNLVRTEILTEVDLNEAAQRAAADIAVYYSDDHWEQKVPIMYTDPRHVAK